MVPAMDRIEREVGERVVHPPHVPLESETEAPLAHGLGHVGPAGGLFGDGDARGLLVLNGLVELLQELHRLEGLAAAVNVAQPFSRLARDVPTEHLPPGIDAY